MSPRVSRPRMLRGWLSALRLTAVLMAGGTSVALAGPYVPADDNAVLAEVSAGTRFADVSARRLAAARIDVAIPLAQFYIQQSRLSGDLRFLGYAEAVLAPWLKEASPKPDVLVLQATLQQSRHQFSTSLATLDHALALRPKDPQALLIRATVLRVLGRYSEAGAACEQFSQLVEPRLAAVCIQSLRGLSGHLESAYSSLSQVSTQGWLNSEKSWLYSELGEMAVRLGRDGEAERWFQQDLRLVPTDFYVRAAYADLMLQQGRAGETLALLAGQESLEPLLLRIAIAQKQQRDPALERSCARLNAAFAAELQRGEAVHRREQARFLLEVLDRPDLSLAAALENWSVQHEPDDVLVLMRAARATGNPGAAAPAVKFIRAQGQSDVRVDALNPALAASR